MDLAWCRVYHKEVKQHFKGRWVTPARQEYGAERVRFKHGGNSGAGAISLAAHWGAKRIILLGYDCKFAADGKRHWHGDHPKGLGNCNSLPRFAAQFLEISKHVAGVQIVNATRDTALTIWPRVPLEEALNDHHA